MLGCCWQCWGGGNIWEQLAARWCESWGFPMSLPVFSQLLEELRGWLIIPLFQAFTRMKKAALKMWLHIWMGVRWTGQSWVCSAAAASCSLSICSRAWECPFGEQSWGCKCSIGDEKIEICFQGGAGKLPAACSRDNSAGSGSIVVAGSKVNSRKMFRLNRLSFLFCPKGSICSEPDLLFSLLREFLNET